MPKFASQINIHPGTGAYVGTWCIVNDATGAIIRDYPTESLALAALPKIRKDARDSAAARDRMERRYLSREPRTRTIHSDTVI